MFSSLNLIGNKFGRCFHKNFTQKCRQCNTSSGCLRYIVEGKIIVDGARAFVIEELGFVPNA